MQEKTITNKPKPIGLTCSNKDTLWVSALQTNRYCIKIYKVSYKHNIYI